jgi:hypothetical protein
LVEVKSMRHAGWSIAFTLAVVTAAALASAAPAGAYGYCGTDSTGATACPVASNTTVAGTISSNTEYDYYVFYVARQTDLQLTITDTENADCSNYDPSYGYGCGNAQVSLLDSKGNDLEDSQSSSPNNGVTVPESIEKTIGRGVYYLEVSGFLDPYTLPSIPYQLTVDGNPGVQWPPACIVPRIRRGTSLGRVEHLVRDGRCTVGAVHYVHSAIPRGDVVGLDPRAGAIRAYGAPVAIYVSGTPRRHVSHHPHHRRRHRGRAV